LGAEARRDWLPAGRVGRPHGLDGSFHVTQAKPQLLDVGVVLQVTGTERRIERRAGHDAGVILRLEGCTDREGAEALRGQDLHVERGAAPELGPDEWWAEELEGCTVHDGDRPVGRVLRLLALPSCEVLEVERADGEGQLLVPLVSDAVRSVDTARRQIDVNLGFLGEA
jgi:16S rRNA processing protein RimM